MIRRGGMVVPLVLLVMGLLLVLLAWQGLRLPASTATVSLTPCTATVMVLSPDATVAADASVSATPTGEARPMVMTATARPTAIRPATATRTLVWTPVPTVVASETPAIALVPVPTFTPPPIDGMMATYVEHYWLQRPIGAEYTNWTDRIYPYGSTRGGSFRTHHGVEFFNPVGVPVLAAASGVVVTAGSDDQVLFGPQASFYGNLVVVRHDQLYGDQYVYSLYGHLSQVLVNEGRPVASGDVIGLVGGTGVANGGAHLHFEVRVGANSYDTTRNPELWLQPFPGWGTIAGRVMWPDGSYVYEAPLLIQRADDPTLFVRRTVYTYADDTVNPDGVLGENFTSPDVEPGPYEVIMRSGTSTYRELVWVYPGRTSFLTIELGAGPTPEP